MAGSSHEVELPPDVGSSSSDDVAMDGSPESDIVLPDDMQTPCCKKNCLDKVSETSRANADKLKDSLALLGLPAKNTIWFNQLLNMNREHLKVSISEFFSGKGMPCA